MNKTHAWEMNAEQVRVLGEALGYASAVRVVLTAQQQDTFTEAWLRHCSSRKVEFP